MKTGNRKNKKKSGKNLTKNREKAIKIKAALILKGLKQKDIARELGITPAAVSMLIHGKRKSKRFEEWVKKHLGVDI
jgi:transcriptional regulator